MNWVSKELRQMARGQDCLINSPMCNHNAETTVLCHGRKGTGMAEFMRAVEGLAMEYGVQLSARVA